MLAPLTYPTVTKYINIKHCGKKTEVWFTRAKSAASTPAVLQPTYYCVASPDWLIAAAPELHSDMTHTLLTLPLLV